MNLLIPMAGAGQRFVDAGYTVPKPLIDVEGLPMVVRVVKEAGFPDCQKIFLVQYDHFRSHGAATILEEHFPGCRIIPVQGVTQGAACTTLLARGLIDNDEPLVIMNSDQIIHWDAAGGLEWMLEEPSSGGIVTFQDPERNPKWSFAQVEDNWVRRVAEKDPISDQATAGMYVWRRGRDYVSAAEQMILADERVNGEFYVCPVYNTAIQQGHRFRVFPVQEMMGLGTPEDLYTYVKRQRVGI